MRAVLVISPHLDDAVLSAGQFLSGRPDVVLATIFAGMPRGKTVLTTYDQQCGFKNAEEAVTRRRAENVAAAALVGAEVKHLAFVDSQYGLPADISAVAKCIQQLIEEHEVEFVVGPLGLFHPDHVLVREAVLEAMTGRSEPLWLYEDIPNRVWYPETVPEALEAVKGHGFIPTLGFCGTGSLDQKMSALWCYRSQLPLFKNHHELLVGERFWEGRQVMKLEVDNG